MKRLGWMVAVLLALAGCAGPEKYGDRAAAVGDWKTAYVNYRNALANDPDDKELKAKFEQARTRALADAQSRAQACAQVADWSCALAEADFAVQVEPGNAEAAAFRANAATQVALRTLEASQAQAQQGQFLEAHTGYRRALELSAAPEVRERSEPVRQAIVKGARPQADTLRRQRDLPGARALAQVVAGLDGSAAGWAQGIEAEYQQWANVEAERLAREGDGYRAQREWERAHDAYVASAQLRPQGRAAPMVEYTKQVGRAEERIGQRDWKGATEGYRAALRTGGDDGYASRQLEKVEPRPYAVRMRSVMVSPLRPDGNSWAGVGSPIFNRIARTMMEAARRSGQGDLAVELAMTIPMENRPNLRVEAVLPDGAHLTTPTRQGVYVGYDSEFVVLANGFDERRVELRVFAGNEQVDSVSVPLSDLVERRRVRLQSQSIIALDLDTGRADGRTVNSAVGMTPVPPGGPAHAATPGP